MIKRDTIIEYLSDYFADYKAKAIQKDPHMGNGVQIIGKDRVKRVVLGVSLSVALIEKAIEKGAQLLIVHHGINFSNLNGFVDTSLKKRLKLILENDLTLLGFHYLLDAHPKIGNNAVIIKRLSGTILGPFSHEWGFYARFKRRMKIEEIIVNCQRLFNHKIVHIPGKKEEVEIFAVISGRGVPYNTNELVEKKAELLITGEISEWNPEMFKEADIHYLACGHYATEVLGIKELTEILKRRFQELEIEYIDIPNEI